MPHVISIYSDDKSNNFVFIWKYIILSHFIYVELDLVHEYLYL